MSDNVRDIDEKTKQAEDSDAHTSAGADRAPTPSEAEAAPDKADPEVAEHFEEMMEKGANLKGEGRVEL